MAGWFPSMVRRQELIRMLIDALSFEEITVLGRLEAFLRDVRDSGMDEITRTEIERKTRRMLVESIRHSKTLTKMVRRVMKSEQNEY
jgi:hypothetical protein